MTQRPAYPTETNSATQGLSRLVMAAVVNQTFCQLLLNDPAQALEVGYSGETFQLTHDERRTVLSIRATSLADFASQLLAAENDNHARRQNGHKSNGNGYQVHPSLVRQQLASLKT
ncbi:MAG TPA: hypothetical protein PKE64_06950 [Anaerolineae bacterium]|nr:hypothetical protein [Anaerolineae bacterium]HMR63735.1 hypothetical protein [Anaerolineae bacterium]